MPYVAKIHDCWCPGPYRRALARVAPNTTWRCPKCGAEWVWSSKGESPWGDPYGPTWNRVVSTTPEPTEAQKKLHRKGRR